MVMEPVVVARWTAAPGAYVAEGLSDIVTLLVHSPVDTVSVEVWVCVVVSVAVPVKVEVVIGVSVTMFMSAGVPTSLTGTAAAL